MEELFPVFEVPELIGENSEYDNRYKRSAMWDFEIGDFKRNGAKQIVEADGIEAYRTWCIKTAYTERFSHLAYPSEIGVEMEEARKEPDEKAVESSIERTITEALMVNPRTEYVRDFKFRWNGDNINISFLVKGINIEEMIIEV